MNTSVRLWLAAILTAAALAWSMPAAGQEFNIEIPLPSEPGQVKDRDRKEPAARRANRTRSADKQTRRSEREPLDEAPKFLPSQQQETVSEPGGMASDGPSAVRPGRVADRMPDWEIAAESPSAPGPMAKGRKPPRIDGAGPLAVPTDHQADRRGANAVAPEPRTNRGPSGASVRGGLLGRVISPGGRTSDSAPLLARRHRGDSRARDLKEPSPRGGWHEIR